MKAGFQGTVTIFNWMAAWTLFKQYPDSMICNLAILNLASWLAVNLLIASFVMVMDKELQQLAGKMPLLAIVSCGLSLAGLENLSLLPVFGMYSAVDVSQYHHAYQVKSWIGTLSLLPKLYEQLVQFVLQSMMAFVILNEHHAPWPQLAKAALAINLGGLVFLTLGDFAKAVVDPRGAEGDPELLDKPRVPLENFLGLGAFHHIGLVTGVASTVVEVLILQQIQDYMHVWLLIAVTAAFFAWHAIMQLRFLRLESSFSSVAAYDLWFVPRAGIVIPLSFISPLSTLLFHPSKKMESGQSLLEVSLPSLIFHMMWIGWILAWLWWTYFEVRDPILEAAGSIHALVVIADCLGIAAVAAKTMLPPKGKAHDVEQAKVAGTMSTVPRGRQVPTEDELLTRRRAGSSLSVLAVVLAIGCSYLTILGNVTTDAPLFVILDLDDPSVPFGQNLTGLYALRPSKEKHAVYQLLGLPCTPTSCPTISFRHHRHVELMDNRWVVSLLGLAEGNQQSCDPTDPSFDRLKCALYGVVNDTMTDAQTANVTSPLVKWFTINKLGLPQRVKPSLTPAAQIPPEFVWKDELTVGAEQWNGTYALLKTAEGEPVFYNRRPVYRSEAKATVCVYFAGDSWWLGKCPIPDSATSISFDSSEVQFDTFNLEGQNTDSLTATQVSGVFHRGGSGALPFSNSATSASVYLNGWHQCRDASFELAAADRVCSLPPRKDQACSDDQFFTAEEPERCLKECPSDYFTPSTGNVCQPCDQECGEGCSGPLRTDCVGSCLHLRSTSTHACVATCSAAEPFTLARKCVTEQEYQAEVDEMNKVCSDFSPVATGTSRFGMTCLMKVAKIGNENVTKLLLAKGANEDQVDVLLRTALIWAAYNGHADVAQLLLANGAGPRWTKRTLLATQRFAGLLTSVTRTWRSYSSQPNRT